MIWSFLLHSSCVGLDEKVLRLTLPITHLNNLEEEYFQKLQKQINQILPTPLVIEVSEQNEHQEDTLYEETKKSILNEIENDESFIRMQKNLGLQIIEESIKIY
jgi:hypothetical protein